MIRAEFVKEVVTGQEVIQHVFEVRRSSSDVIKWN